MRRLLALLASFVLAGVLAPVALASADPIGSCTSSTGTIIAVDFGHWGGPVVRGCGVHSSTGAALLDDGGFTHSGTAHDGPAFICRIGNAAFRGGTPYPTPKDEACGNTPPASAYWSYWLAPKGQNSWSYSQLGAYSEKPKQGEVELWQFGGTNIAGTEGRPTISPDALRAKNTRATGGSGSGNHGPRSQARSRLHPRASATHAGAAGSSAATPAGTRPTGAAASSASAAARSSAAAKSKAAATSAALPGAVAPGAVTSGTSGKPTAGGGSPSIVNASAVAKSSSGSSSGSALPVILGVALVLLLGAGGGWGVLRRRRADAAEC